MGGGVFRGGCVYGLRFFSSRVSEERCSRGNVHEDSARQARRRESRDEVYGSAWSAGSASSLGGSCMTGGLLVPGGNSA